MGRQSARRTAGLLMVSVESKRARTGVSPNLVEHALPPLSDDHVQYFEFGRHAVEQTGVVLRLDRRGLPARGDRRRVQPCSRATSACEGVFRDCIRGAGNGVKAALS